MNTARLTRNPTTTPSTRSSGTDRSREMVRSETFTIVLSMIAMNIATTYTTLTAILGLIGRAGMAFSKRVRARDGRHAWTQGRPAARRARRRPGGTPVHSRRAASRSR